MVLEVLAAFLAWLSGTMQFLIQTFGLPGLFFAAILENATLFVGIPLELIIIAFHYATNANPLLIAVIAGLGAAIGELTGYAIGRAGTGIAEKIKHHQIGLFNMLEKQIDAKGPFAVFLLLLLPIPFVLVGIASGIAKMNPLKFFLATFAGKTTRFFLVLIAASFGIKLLLGFFGAAS